MHGRAGQIRIRDRHVSKIKNFETGATCCDAELGAV